MRLSAFIRQREEEILAEWEAFARTLLPSAEGMNSLSLRDHAPQILEAVAKDLDTPQTREQQSEKSKGNAPKIEGAPATAAQTHAILRARGGFDIIQLVAEYRALRASVLRLWLDSGPLGGSTAMDDVVRFNEAIDQAIAESVGHFHAQVERSRNLFLGMLGHDMRSPLSTILATAAHLGLLNAGEQVSVAAARLIRSGRSMQALLDDLLDFNRSNLGLGIRIVRTGIDLTQPVTDEVEQLRAVDPRHEIELAISGDCRGEWDGMRVQQCVRNLVVNAMTYGTPGTPIRVCVRGEHTDVHLEVANDGAIHSSTDLFDPLRRGVGSEEKGPHSSLGLGLYIVRKIAEAHGGDVQVHSSESATRFSIRLPRHAGN